MEDQQDMFPDIPKASTEFHAPPNARKNDPGSSHEAGRKIEGSGKAGAQRFKVLVILKHNSRRCDYRREFFINILFVILNTPQGLVKDH